MRFEPILFFFALPSKEPNSTFVPVISRQTNRSYDWHIQRLLWPVPFVLWGQPACGATDVPGEELVSRNHSSRSKRKARRESRSQGSRRLRLLPGKSSRRQSETPHWLLPHGVGHESGKKKTRETTRETVPKAALIPSALVRGLVAQAKTSPLFPRRNHGCSRPDARA